MHVDGFVPITTASEPIGSALAFASLPAASSASGSSLVPIPVSERYIPGVAEESDLIRLGDVVLGVSGVCVLGMDEVAVRRIISLARSMTPGALVVLHLCDYLVDEALIEEAATQISNAAAQLLNSPQIVEGIQTAAYEATVAATALELAGGGVGGGGSSSAVAGSAAAADGVNLGFLARGLPDGRSTAYPYSASMQADNFDVRHKAAGASMDSS